MLEKTHTRSRDLDREVSLDSSAFASAPATSPKPLARKAGNAGLACDGLKKWLKLVGPKTLTEIHFQKVHSSPIMTSLEFPNLK